MYSTTNSPILASHKTDGYSHIADGFSKSRSRCIGFTIKFLAYNGPCILDNRLYRTKIAGLSLMLIQKFHKYINKTKKNPTKNNNISYHRPAHNVQLS
jgi:hypothetical protein